MWVEGHVGFEPFAVLVVCEESDACDRLRASSEGGGASIPGSWLTTDGHSNTGNVQGC